jgi:hypothetical protein
LQWSESHLLRRHCREEIIIAFASPTNKKREKQNLILPSGQPPISMQSSWFSAVGKLLAPVETEAEKERREQGPRDRFNCLVRGVANA